MRKTRWAKASIPTSAKPDELRAYMAEILPDYDRDRVYPSDIKKIIMWYNQLLEAGITDFKPIEVAAEAPAQEEEKAE